MFIKSINIKSSAAALIACFLFSYTMDGQELPKDCFNALNICKPVYHFNEIYLGEGVNRFEINGAISCLKRGENNSMWFLVKVKSDGDLGFLITPDSPMDIDWSVYNLTKSPCTKISHDNSIETSCNFSDTSFFPSEKGKTGATGATNITHGDMNSSPYNRKIPVKAGETYVIAVVTWWTLNRTGFTIDFSLSTADIFDTGKPQINSVDNDACGGDELRIKFSKYIDCSSIEPGDFLVNGPGGPYILSEINSENCSKTSFKFDDEFVFKISPSIFKKGSYNLITTGTYSDICGITNSLPESIDFSVNDMPVVITTDRADVCAGEKVQLLANADGKPPFIYEWFPSQFLSCSNCQNPKATLFETTVFLVRITDQTGCTTEDSIKINVIPAPVINIIHGDTSICELGTVQLEVATPGILNPVVRWSPATGLSATDILNPIVNLAETTEYTVTITDPQTGCNNQKKITVWIGKPIQPIVTLSGKSGNVEICPNDLSELDAGESDPLTNEEYIKFQWFKDNQLLPDSSRQYLLINQPGTYRAEITSKGGCKGSSVINVALIPFPENRIIFPKTVCTGGIFKLKAEIDGTKDNYSVKWINTEGFTGSNTDWEPDIILDIEGNYQYILEYTDKSTFCKDYDTVIVQAKPGVSLSLGDDLNACPGEKVTLIAQINGGGNGFSFKWLPAGKVTIPNIADSSIAEIIAYNNEKVILEVSNDGGCMSTDTLLLNIPVPIAEMSIPKIEFSSRQRDVIIPVYFKYESDLLRCKPKYARLKLEWDFSIFNPRKAFAKGQEIYLQRDFKQNSRTWEVTLDIPDTLINSPGNNLVEILGDAMLGENDTAGLFIKSVQWDTFIVNNSLQSGFLKINDICEIGGKRLIDYSGAFIIKSITPVPARENIKMELQFMVKLNNYKVKIINIFGEIISESSILNPEEFESEIIYTGDLTPGVYRIVVSSGSENAFADLLIIR